jgi:valyl-tRNA synthetase
MQGKTTSGFKNLKNIDLLKLTADEKWILSKLNSTVESISKHLEKFSFHIATHELYEFVWSEFCDWFIESSKGRIFAGEEDKEQFLTVLDFVLYTILRLLHPFMPYITEELSHLMGFLEDGETIMFAPYPVSFRKTIIGQAIDDPATISLVESKFDIIRAGRNMRAIYNIQAGKKLNFALKIDNKTTSDFINSQLEIIKNMLCADKLDIFSGDAAQTFEGPTPYAVLNCGTLFLPLKNAVDLATEIAKLNKQKKELEGWINGSKAKLLNQKFLNNAPQEVVESAKEHLAELERKLSSVNEMLKVFQP